MQTMQLILRIGDRHNVFTMLNNQSIASAARINQIRPSRPKLATINSETHVLHQRVNRPISIESPSICVREAFNRIADAKLIILSYDKMIFIRGVAIAKENNIGSHVLFIGNSAKLLRPSLRDCKISMRRTLYNVTLRNERRG